MKEEWLRQLEVPAQALQKWAEGPEIHAEWYDLCEKWERFERQFEGRLNIEKIVLSSNYSPLHNTDKQVRLILRNLTFPFVIGKGYGAKSKEPFKWEI